MLPPAAIVQLGVQGNVYVRSWYRSYVGRSSNVAVYCSIDIDTIRLYRFEVEATPAGEPTTHPKNYGAAHMMWRTILAGAAMLPFRPDRVAIHGAAEQFDSKVGNKGENSFLILPYLIPPGE